MTPVRSKSGINKTDCHNMVDAQNRFAMVNSGRHVNLSQKKRK